MLSHEIHVVTRQDHINTSRYSSYYIPRLLFRGGRYNFQMFSAVWRNIFSENNFSVMVYGWRNGAKFKKFIFTYIQCSCSSSRIYLFTFTCVFLIHNYICSHLLDVFIYIQRVISIHICDRNINSTFSAHHLCASVSIKQRLRSTDYGLQTGYKTWTGYKTRTGV